MQQISFYPDNKCMDDREMMKLLLAGKVLTGELKSIFNKHLFEYRLKGNKLQLRQWMNDKEEFEPWRESRVLGIPETIISVRDSYNKD